MGKRVDALVIDVDGTLTDGKLYITDNGELFKAFNIKDGYGIKDLLTINNVIPIVITGRTSLIVKKRCDELGITHLYQGIKDKKNTLLQILKSLNISLDRVAYIGDDDNDLECIELVLSNGGIVGCPADSSGNILKINNIYICKSKGGQGAVREFIEYIISDDCIQFVL